MSNELVSLVNHIATPLPNTVEFALNRKVEHWYIASPFSSDDPEQTEIWVEQIKQITENFIILYPAVSVFSPVAYTAQFANSINPSAGWYKVCLHHLEKCDRLVIVQLEGWEKSAGIALEIGFANAKKMKISAIDVRRFKARIKK